MNIYIYIYVHREPAQQRAPCPRAGPGRAVRHRAVRILYM